MSALRLILALLLLGGAMVAPFASHDAVAQTEVVVVRPVTVTEAALSSCAGGAVIGYLLVFASGVGSANGTALLFCGLSAAATVTSTATAAVWRGATSWMP